MANWIADAVPDIAVAKTDYRPRPSYITADQWVGMVDWNQLRSAALETRYWIRGADDAGTARANWVGMYEHASDPQPFGVGVTPDHGYLYATPTQIHWRRADGTDVTLGGAYTASAGVSLTLQNFTINPAYGMTWTVPQRFHTAAVATTQTMGVEIKNPSIAALGAQQWSPGLTMAGSGYATGTPGPQSVELMQQLAVYQGVTSPEFVYQFSSRYNGGAWTQFAEINDRGALDLASMGVRGRANGIIQVTTNATTTGSANFQAYNNSYTNGILLSVYGTAKAGNILGLPSAGTASLTTDNATLSIATGGINDIRIGTNSTLRTTWDAATGNITHRSNFTLLTAKTLTAGVNTLISGDKLQAAQISTGTDGHVLTMVVGVPTWTASGGVYTGSAGVALVGSDFRFNLGYAPTWTALHTFNLGLTAWDVAYFGSDVIIDSGYMELGPVPIQGINTDEVQLGVNSATPIAYMLKGSGGRGGTDTNVAGAALLLAGGQATGNAAGGAVQIWQHVNAAAGGTTATPLVLSWEFESPGPGGGDGTAMDGSLLPGANGYARLGSDTKRLLSGWFDYQVYANLFGSADDTNSYMQFDESDGVDWFLNGSSRMRLYTTGLTVPGTITLGGVELARHTVKSLVVADADTGATTEIFVTAATLGRFVPLYVTVDATTIGAITTQPSISIGTAAGSDIEIIPLTQLSFTADNQCRMIFPNSGAPLPVSVPASTSIRLVTSGGVTAAYAITVHLWGYYTGAV